MRNDGQQSVQASSVGGAAAAAGGVPRFGKISGGGSASVNNANNNCNGGFLPSSFKALSSYFKIVSSGASSVASTVKSAASAASAMVERDTDSGQDQVHWAGFDKLECEGGVSRQVLLLGYHHGFQVWDVEEANNVRNLVSRQDGPVSFIQVLPKPVLSKQSEVKFADSRPLLIICADESFSGDTGIMQEGLATPCNGTVQYGHDSRTVGCVPTVVWFYSLRSQSYVHFVKFRAVVLLVRCSARVVAVLQTAQVHCFNAATLKKEYTFLTNPILPSCSGSGGIGFGPLAVGPRWFAYSGSPVLESNAGRVSPQHLTPSASFPNSTTNGSLVAHYAKESSKHIAAGLVTLGDMGRKKLSRYYSELVPDGSNSQPGNSRVKVQGVTNGHTLDAESTGMVIVRDVVSKTVIAQFRAHKSSISSLCFDPSGTLLVTASVQGHNINVFRIMPKCSGSSGADSGSCSAHLYRLQRGFTNAVIQDISFSNDSRWIMISSSKGTSHLFAISPSGGPVNVLPHDAFASVKSGRLDMTTRPSNRWLPSSGLQVLNQLNICASGPPITLSVVSRIRSGNSGWRNTVNGAAAAATGRTNSYLGTVASAFHNFKSDDTFTDTSFSKTKYHLLVFSSPGCLIHYGLEMSLGPDSMTTLPVANANNGSGPETCGRLLVEAIQKWNICQRQNRKGHEDNIDVYGENGNLDSSKIFPDMGKGTRVCKNAKGIISKDRISSEERHNMYISEAELQMHQGRIPLWAKDEIYFQSLVTDGDIDEKEMSTGEIEIERVPSRIIEARSKNLVPVFDYRQATKSRHSRMPLINGTSGQLLSHGPELSEKCNLSCRRGSGSSYSTDNEVAGVLNTTEEDRLDGIGIPTETNEGFVNNSDGSKGFYRLENVNNRESHMGETQLSVHNDKEGLEMENQVQDDPDEFD